MDYLYDKMRKKIDEILARQKKIDIHSLAQTLPNKVRLTRLDAYKIIEEMNKKGLLYKEGNLILKKKDRR